jgi:hypothetical protein
VANRERIQKFVDGLRFGGYRQFYGGLGRRQPGIGDRFCALGVACEVARANDLDVGVDYSAFGGFVSYYDPADPTLKTAEVLPRLVADWYGVAELGMPVGVTHDEVLALNPTVVFGPGYDGRVTDLVSLNDGARLTFAQIADLVERTYLKEDDPV